MTFPYCSKNGELIPIAQATMPISSIEFTYGFGVYESIRVSKGTVYFVKDHLERLQESARTIGLEHPFTEAMIAKSITELLKKNATDTCNIKLLLIGASEPQNAQLFIQCFNPLFPDRSLYRDGVSLMSYQLERLFPHAKTLNMLPSYIAYTSAQKQGAYDALLVNTHGDVLEGTRTNFFCITDHVIYTPPEKEILLGVARKGILHVARQNGYEVKEVTLPLKDIFTYDGAFISSTSLKMAPIRAIDGKNLLPQPKALQQLMGHFNDFLDTCNGIFPVD